MLLDFHSTVTTLSLLLFNTVLDTDFFTSNAKQLVFYPNAKQLIFYPNAKHTQVIKAKQNVMGNYCFKGFYIDALTITMAPCYFNSTEK